MHINTGRNFLVFSHPKYAERKYKAINSNAIWLPLLIAIENIKTDNRTSASIKTPISSLFFCFSDFDTYRMAHKLKGKETRIYEAKKIGFPGREGILIKNPGVSGKTSGIIKNIW
jgi:hypothetical protein